MNNKYPYIVGLLALVMLVGCREARIEDHKEWASFFEAEQVNGAIEYIDNNKERVHYYNKDFNAKQLVPGGAFEIFATLVALESSVAPTEQYIIKGDSSFYSFKEGVLTQLAVADTHQAGFQKEWSKDLSLSDAFKYQSIPHFNTLIGAISKDEFQHYVDTLRYGNRKTDSIRNDFWYNGTLTISADEQVSFIKKLYHGEVTGFTERSQRITKSMLDKENKENYSLYYKKYTTLQSDTLMVQYIGYVEKIKILRNPKSKELEYIPHPYFFVISVFDTKDKANLEAKAARIFENIRKETDLKEVFDNFDQEN